MMMPQAVPQAASAPTGGPTPRPSPHPGPAGGGPGSGVIPVPAPGAPPRKVLDITFTADRNRLFTAWNAVANLADLAG